MYDDCKLAYSPNKELRCFSFSNFAKPLNITYYRELKLSNGILIVLTEYDGECKRTAKGIRLLLIIYVMPGSCFFYDKKSRRKVALHLLVEQIQNQVILKPESQE